MLERVQLGAALLSERQLQACDALAINSDGKLCEQSLAEVQLSSVLYKPAQAMPASMDLSSPALEVRQIPKRDVTNPNSLIANPGYKPTSTHTA
ncbi:hypothetical protein VC273_08740 [Xanthomonas nasturtii]|uniref:hypothetical protein n=1 Tax=Xanthomonas TaxID=338 RepID=UPI002B22AFFA|nr:hypothetical protein [Xanthomonas nasturtii]MEA9555999.1 hypothetical protein [Xanthomonas nasturtii]